MTGHWGAARGSATDLAVTEFSGTGEKFNAVAGWVRLGVTGARPFSVPKWVA